MPTKLGLPREPSHFRKIIDFQFWFCASRNGKNIFLFQDFLTLKEDLEQLPKYVALSLFRKSEDLQTKIELCFDINTVHN